jgi:hypothetical protein
MKTEYEMETVRYTQSTANSRSRWRGCLLKIWMPDGSIARYTIPTMRQSALDYCRQHPRGKHASTLRELFRMAGGPCGF